jgi:hypothetical protein
MTPKEALEVIDSTLAQISLNRAGHETIMRALSVIGKAIEPREIPIIKMGEAPNE